MSVEFKTPVIHHIALRSTDLARSNQFYTQLDELDATCISYQW
jgi:hypothetical protein